MQSSIIAVIDMLDTLGYSLLWTVNTLGDLGRIPAVCKLSTLK